MQRPLLLKGEPGCGKTRLARAVAYELKLSYQEWHVKSTSIAREGCYVYDAVGRLRDAHLPLRKNSKRKTPGSYVRWGPLGNAFRSKKRTVLLIDEIDRSDEEFEAFLLEVLSDFQITIPEIGTLKAENKPMVIVTSNRTRDVHDALKRRCLYHWIEYPSFDKEYRIIMSRLPGIESVFSEQVTRFMQKIRTVDFLKKPGISETLDWAHALMTMHRRHLDEETVMETLGCILKYQEDIKKFKEEVWMDAEQRAAYL